EISAQDAAVKGSRRDSSTSDCRSRFTVVVGMRAAGQKFHFGICFEEVDRLHARREIGGALTARAWRLADDEAVEINSRLGEAVLVACSLALTVLGYPERAGGA